MQPDKDSNAEPFAYRANALPTELSQLPTYNSPDYIQVYSRYNVKCASGALLGTFGSSIEISSPGQAVQGLIHH